MKLLSWNVNGIRARYNNNHIQQVFDQSPDIICLQEVKANPEQIPSQLLELDDYHFYLNHNKSNSYTGVGIFTKEEPINIERGFENLEEGRVLKQNLMNSHCTIFIFQMVQDQQKN
ncbi:endonuclease/exonuclease/phosphatase family protein [Methanobacterium alcaliphilum]|uniref:endonuclease/exonuclease/phosphatase family protein n=1 Tax=Methanobacterium alcaliphilum TaxID=392018 RepID=UPI002009DD9E|nr:endonuclease/exonuclease/phosphatase family protein [Methanobacterium alcaliphilum]MCK9151662.1 endonuclease/exonuclease/phosphatase family protein [Methanobacterium alcaliphilum]